MIVEDSDTNRLCTLRDWENLYGRLRKSKHWKEGHSAHSLATFIVEQKGVDILQKRVADACGESVTFERSIVEYKVPFDEYRSPRVHDLGIYGQTETGKKLFVGVEAKVDEPFGRIVCDEYREAQKKNSDGLKTNKPARIEGLLKRFSLNSDPSRCDLHYQLLHATVATREVEAGLSVFYVVVFKTASFVEGTGKKNFRDYLHFIKSVGGQSMKHDGEDVSVHELTVDGKPLVCIYESFDFP